MKINLLSYKNAFSTLKAYRQANLSLSLSDLMTNYAVSTHTPLIVCAFYLLKIEGDNVELIETIKRLQLFYKYDEIVGIEELMNWDEK